MGGLQNKAEAVGVQCVFGDLAGGETGQGYLARQDHGYINVPWRRREAATSSKQHRAQAERDCLILSGNTTSHTLLPKPQAWAGTACSLSGRLAGGGGKRRQPSRGSPPAKALTGFGRALSRSRGAQVLLVSQSAPAQSLSSAVLDPPVQRACSNQAPIRELSLTATHSSPPAEGATPGSSSTCTNHNAFLLCVDLSGVAACVFRDFSVAFPKPHPT